MPVWCHVAFRDRQECLSSCDRQECLSSCDEKRLLTLILSIWAAWQLLFGPATEQFTYGILAPSAAWAVLVSFAEKRARWLTVAAWALLAFGPAGDIERAVARIFPASPILAPLGVVLFVAWLVWHERGEVPAWHSRPRP